MHKGKHFESMTMSTLPFLKTGFRDAVKTLLFRSLPKCICCLCLLCVAIFTTPITSAQPQFRHRFFKEKQVLKVDTQRIAILQRDGMNDDVVSAEFTKRGLSSDDKEQLPIQGWRVARIAGKARQASGVAELVHEMSAGKAFAFVSPVFIGADGGPIIVTPDLLVGFNDGVTPEQAEAALKESGAGTIRDRNWANMKGVFRLRSALATGIEVLNVADALADLPEVRFAEPDMIFTGRGGLIPNDTSFSTLWGVHNTGQSGGVANMDMDGPEAWDMTTGSSSIVVAVLDTGVQPDHPDINQIPGTNTTTDASVTGAPVNTCDNHGTPVAGCISATINNSLGVAGIAPGCRIASARTFISGTATCNGSWTSFASWTVESLAWAQRIGARVSNNSNGYGFQSAAIAAKYAETRAAGMVHFASAGNNGTTTIGYPASLPDVNAIAALNRTGVLASFSDRGIGLDFSAPGESILSPDRTGSSGYVIGDYATMNGTSFASPYAAGVAALVLSVKPSSTAAQVEQILAQSCKDLGATGYDTTFGWGFVNARAAVLLARNQATILLTPTRSGDNLDLTASGLTGWSSLVLQFSTNLTHWTSIRTNATGGSATLSITNSINPALPGGFFRGRAF